MSDQTRSLQAVADGRLQQEGAECLEEAEVNHLQKAL